MVSAYRHMTATWQPHPWHPPSRRGPRAVDDVGFRRVSLQRLRMLQRAAIRGPLPGQHRKVRLVAVVTVVRGGGELARWVNAFPTAFANDVPAAVAAIPDHSVAKPTGALLTPASTDSGDHPVGILVDGESIVIPSRMYNDHLRPADAPEHLTARQRTILGCIYTRHHIGFVRQRWARQILTSDQPFVVPFVIQLLGEYVVEIIADIYHSLPELDDPDSATAQLYGRFLADNPGYHFLTRQRVASYWD